MTDFTPRITTQQQLGYVEHTSVSGEAWTFIKAGVATSNGAAGGTTIIDTGGDSGAAYTYSGAYWVRMTSGTCKGEWKRIVGDNGSGTLTLEGNGFSAQIDSADEYEIWKSPEPVLTVTTSTSTTQFTCSARTEATDTWVGYYACVLYATDNGGTSPARGELQQITASTTGGVITVGSAFTNQPRVGDVLLIRRFVEAAPSMTLNEAYYDRPQNRVNFAIGDGVVGPRSGSVSFATHVYGSGALSASGSVAGRSVLRGLFGACGFAENADTSATVGAGSTTSAISVASGSWENFTIGGMVVWNGNPAWITSMTDGGVGVDTINVTPALPTAPATSDTLYASRGYFKSTTGDTYGVTVEWETDGYRVTATGCKGNVSYQTGEPATLNWELQIDHFVDEIEAAPYNAGTAYTTSSAILDTDRTCYLSTTKTSISGFTASLNAEATGKMIQGADGVNGRSGFQFTGLQKAGGSWQELINSSGTSVPQLERWLARTAKDFIVFMGSGSNIFACRMPVARLMARPNAADQSGLLGIPQVVQAQDAGTATDGGSTVQKIPDFAFFIT